MSKYCKVNASLKLTNLARLKEALKRAWQARFGISLDDSDIEVHKTPAPLLDYTGRVTDKVAHVIIRGTGVRHAVPPKVDEVPVGKNCHPGLNNDFGLIDTDGSGINLEAEVDHQIEDVVKLVKLYETALGIESHIKKRIIHMPDTLVRIQGKIVTNKKEIADTIVKYTQQKINPVIEVVNAPKGGIPADIRTSKGQVKGIKKSKHREFEG